MYVIWNGFANFVVLKSTSRQAYTVKPVDRERVMDQKFCSEYTIVP